MITFKQYLEEIKGASLYHGTYLQYVIQILKDNTLKANQTHGWDQHSKRAISFTRSFGTASNWRMGARGGPKPGLAPVLEIDRQRLSNNYRIMPIEIEYLWAKKEDKHDYTPKSSKLYEEYVTKDITPLDRYLVAVHLHPNVWQDITNVDLAKVKSRYGMSLTKKDITTISKHPLIMVNGRFVNQ